MGGNDSESNFDSITSVHLQMVSIMNGSFKKHQPYLIVCYEKGFQVFDIRNPGKFKELTSKRTSQPVDCAKLMYYPHDDYINNRTRGLLEKYPLLCIVTKTDTFNPVVKFFSLRQKEFTDEISGFREGIREIHVNSRLFVVVMKRKMYWYNPLTFEKIIKIEMFPYGSIALGARFIAFSSVKEVKNSSFVVLSDQSSLGTYAKKTAKALLSIGEKSTKKLGEMVKGSKGDDIGDIDYRSLKQCGTVEIIDIITKKTLCHFKAHQMPVVRMQFSHSGTKLVTASSSGTFMNVYEIFPKKKKKIGDGAEVKNREMEEGGEEEKEQEGNIDKQEEVKNESVKLVCRITRGFTNAVIKNINFSVNDDWVVVTSGRYTSHIFNISPKVVSSNCKALEPEGIVNVDSVGRIYNKYIDGEKFVSRRGASVMFYTLSERRSVEEIVAITNNGVFSHYELSAKDKIVDSPKKLEIKKLWSRNVQREEEFSDFTANGKAVMWERKRNKSAEIRGDLLNFDDNTTLISNVEIESYKFPEYPMWMVGKFQFKTYGDIDEENRNFARKGFTRGVFSKQIQKYDIDLTKTVLVPAGPPIPYEKLKKMESEKESIVPSSTNEDNQVEPQLEEWEIVQEQDEDFHPEVKPIGKLGGKGEGLLKGAGKIERDEEEEWEIVGHQPLKKIRYVKNIPVPVEQRRPEPEKIEPFRPPNLFPPIEERRDPLKRNEMRELQETANDLYPQVRVPKPYVVEERVPKPYVGEEEPINDSLLPPNFGITKKKKKKKMKVFDLGDDSIVEEIPKPAKIKKKKKKKKKKEKSLKDLLKMDIPKRKTKKEESETRNEMNDLLNSLQKEQEVESGKRRKDTEYDIYPPPDDSD